MTGKLLAWLVLEGISGTENLRYKHIGLFSGNTAAVLLTHRGEKYVAAGRLLRVLALWQQVARALPLLDVHVAGDLNVLHDISYCSFGYYKQWHCTNDYKFLSLINPQVPLPHQRSWQGFLLFFALSTKVISELGKKISQMGEWK